MYFGVMREIFGPKWDEVKGKCRKLIMRNSLSNIIRVIKSRRM